MRGRDVILLGPAAHITETPLEIPGATLVCRVGACYPLAPALESATGNRCDYWYMANETLEQSAYLCGLEQIKHIKTAAFMRDVIPEPFRYKWVDLVSDEAALESALGCYPNTGLRAIDDILQQGPRSLHITGFDFYQGAEPYYPGYVSAPIHQEAKEAKGDLTPHRQGPQIEYFKAHVLPHPAVTVDDVLKRLFGL